MSRRHRGLGAALLLCAVCLLLGAACRSEPSPARDWPGPVVATPGSGATADLPAGTVHRYRLPLEAGRFLRLSVEQRGVDLEVSLGAPDGATLLRVDRPTGDVGSELILAVTGSAGPHLLTIGPGGGAGSYAARIETLRPAGPDDRRLAAAYRRFTRVRELEGGAEQVAELSAVLGDLEGLDAPALRGEVLQRRASRYSLYLGEHERAVEDSRAAAEIFAATGDRLWEALARTDLGTNLLTLMRVDAALPELDAGRRLAHGEGDGFTEARALQALGQAYRSRGELQRALDHYHRALASWPPGDTLSRPSTLHALGVLHARFLGDVEGGRSLLLEARDTWQMPGRAAWKASTLDQLGLLALDDDRAAEALEHFRQALELRHDRCSRALTLTRLALAHGRLGEARRAAERLDEALALTAGEPCPRRGPAVERYAAAVYAALGDPRRAAAAAGRCAALYAARGDGAGRTACLTAGARAELALGRPEAAAETSGRALRIVRGVRPTVLRDDLRTSYFAAVQELYDLHVEALLELGRDGEAWRTAEEARARLLRDVLAESGGGRGDAVPAELARRRESLQRRLNVLENRRLRLAGRESPESGDLRRGIDDVIEDLERVRGEIRRRGGTVDGSGPPSLADLRRQLDGDALLLELRLGDEASTLWAVDRDSLTAHRLPPRRVLERAAEEALHWLRGRRWPQRNPAPLCELSRLLLAPVAGELGARPLLLVPDGVLEAVSFAALPDPAAAGPCRDAPPLVARHDLSYLPSLATLAEQRRRLAGRRPPDGWLAVVADPIYGPGDERLAAGVRGAEDGPPARLARLPWAGAEAAALVDSLPPERTFSATGTAASRRTVLSGRLAGYRVVHFATHGVLHARRPLWLSHLALSRLNDAGEPVDGALYAHEIHRLELPAELVVLSACDTALGRAVRGEGLMAGLPRAFLSAGAARVVVSLWAVDDRGTRDLMVRFYDALLDGGVPPARALRRAQLAMWRQGRPPREWAGFALQGDPRSLPPFRE